MQIRSEGMAAAEHILSSEGGPKCRLNYYPPAVRATLWPSISMVVLE